MIITCLIMQHYSGRYKMLIFRYYILLGFKFEITSKLTKEIRDHAIVYVNFSGICHFAYKKYHFIQYLFFSLNKKYPINKKNVI
jgi:hypothetical protein